MSLHCLSNAARTPENWHSLWTCLKIRHKPGAKDCFGQHSKIDIIRSAISHQSGNELLLGGEQIHPRLLENRTTKCNFPVCVSFEVQRASNLPFLSFRKQIGFSWGVHGTSFWLRRDGYELFLLMLLLLLFYGQNTKEILTIWYKEPS